MRSSLADRVRSTVLLTARNYTGKLRRLPVHSKAIVQPPNDRYKWVALSNTTLGVLLATIDASIMLIAMPAIFRGIHLDPLRPGNSFYLLWMILGFLVVSSVLVVGVGRLGDLYGRVRMYNLGFVIYTVSSLLLAIDWMHGRAGADWLIAFRIVQGVGAAFLIGQSAAILTDAFPKNQRGLALGITNVVGISGQFIGLVLGGVLAPIDWRLIFLVSVPFGLFGTVWSYLKLRETSLPERAPIDWLGNVTFALGLVLVMIGITYGIRPYGGRPMGWTNPFVDGCLSFGVLLLFAFVFVEQRVEHPMFTLPLFKIRAYTFGVVSNFLSAIARGGLMFMLIIWLQGIWLPEHGYSFTRTPFWAGIYILPLTVGFLIAGPISGYLSDRLRLALPRDGRHAGLGGRVRAAGDAADRFLVLGLRRDPAVDGALDGRVRVAEPRRRDEQPPRPSPWRGRWHEPDLPELGAGALDRHLLHVDDHRALELAAAHALRRARGTRRAARNRTPRCRPAARLGAVRDLPRLQPRRATRAGRGHPPSLTRERRSIDQSRLLPSVDHPAVPGRAARGVPLRRVRLPRRRGRILVARAADARSEGPRGCAAPRRLELVA